MRKDTIEGIKIGIERALAAGNKAKAKYLKRQLFNTLK
jgi:hypothetical protein